MQILKGILALQILLYSLDSMSLNQVEANTVVTSPDNPLVFNTKLIAFDGQDFDSFGHAMALDGDHALISAFGHDSGAEYGGAVYCFQFDGNSWVYRQKLTPTDIEDNDGFGQRISVLGDKALVTSRWGSTNGYSGSGAVYYYEYDGQDWIEEQKLNANVIAMNGDDEFGDSVQISDDYLVVGAGRGEGNAISSGTVHVYEHGVDGWLESQVLMASDGDEGSDFGYSTAVLGNRILVGARYAFNDMNNRTGAAYIFEHNGLNWKETQKLTPIDANVFSRFGIRTALIDNTALIGDTWAEDDNEQITGAVYIYQFDGLNWVMSQKLLASDRVEGDEFGSSISYSENRLIVAARRNDNVGAAYVYELQDDGNWTETMKLVPHDGMSNDLFGGSTQSGDHVLITSPRSNLDGNNKGSVYIYHSDLIFTNGFDELLVK